MARHPAIHIADLWFGYGGSPVLRGVNLSVDRGVFLGLVGPNGSGKSTLIKILTGVLAPQKGQVELFGEPLARFRDWHRVGYVPQKATAFNTSFPATVLEVVLTGRTVRRGLFRPLTRADRQAAEQALADVGIAHLAGRPIGELSGGQQQRAFIARALAGEPDLLILDEPTVGVDARAEGQFYSLLRQLHRQRSLTIVLVSHDIGAVTREVTSLACLNGVVHYHGRPEGFDTRQLSGLYGHAVELVTHNHR